MPASASETLVHYDAKTGQFTPEFIRGREPPVGRALASVLAAMSFFIGVSFVNIMYVDSIGGKVS